ncbi:hypothetical protein BU15DRAFT_82099 [Melanogaster broomeanus]|nr:hypothetical protein BU15DRAFT_82099 [Melanogaster broomeanus]
MLFSTAIPKIIERFGESTVFVEISLIPFFRNTSNRRVPPASGRPPSRGHPKPSSSIPVEKGDGRQGLLRGSQMTVSRPSLTILAGNAIAKQFIAATILDALFMRITHLKTACELFQHLANLFETKKSDATQREATCNPRTPVSIRQTHSEHAGKARDCKPALKKADSTVVEELRDVRCREPKRDAGSHRRVETR